MPGRKSKIAVDLASRNLQTNFNGQAVDKWNMTDLKKFIRVFSPVPARTQGLDKHQLCLKPMQLKKYPVSATEGQVLKSVLANTITVDAAQRQLTSTQSISTSPQSGRLCELCSESAPQSQFPAPAQPGTGHTHQKFTICLSCLRKHISEKSKTAPHLDQIPCPEERCDSLLEASLMQHADPAILERYNNHLTRQHHITQPHYVECSNPGCPFQGPVPLPSSSSSTTTTDFTCPTCHTTTCQTCSTPSHPTQTHAQNTLHLLAQAHHEVTTALTNPTSHSPLHAAATPIATKPCPNPTCRTLLSLATGCPNARCAICAHKFCWWCEAPIVPGGARAHVPGHRCGERLKRLAKRVAQAQAKEQGDGDEAELVGRKAKKAAYLTKLAAENGGLELVSK